MCQKPLFLSFVYNSDIVHRAFHVSTSLAHLLGQEVSNRLINYIRIYQALVFTNQPLIKLLLDCQA